MSSPRDLSNNTRDPSSRSQISCSLPQFLKPSSTPRSDRNISGPLLSTRACTTPHSESGPTPTIIRWKYEKEEWKSERTTPLCTHARWIQKLPIKCVDSDSPVSRKGWFILEQLADPKHLVANIAKDDSMKVSDWCRLIQQWCEREQEFSSHFLRTRFAECLLHAITPRFCDPQYASSPQIIRQFDAKEEKPKKHEGEGPRIFMYDPISFKKDVTFREFFSALCLKNGLSENVLNRWIMPAIEHRWGASKSMDVWEWIYSGLSHWVECDVRTQWFSYSSPHALFLYALKHQLWGLADHIVCHFDRHEFMEEQEVDWNTCIPHFQVPGRAWIWMCQIRSVFPSVWYRTCLTRELYHGIHAQLIRMSLRNRLRKNTHEWDLFFPSLIHLLPFPSITNDVDISSQPNELKSWICFMKQKNVHPAFCMKRSIEYILTNKELLPWLLVLGSAEEVSTLIRYRLEYASSNPPDTCLFIIHHWNWGGLQQLFSKDSMERIIDTHHNIYLNTEYQELILHYANLDSEAHHDITCMVPYTRNELQDIRTIPEMSSETKSQSLLVSISPIRASVYHQSPQLRSSQTSFTHSPSITRRGSHGSFTNVPSYRMSRGSGVCTLRSSACGYNKRRSSLSLINNYMIEEPYSDRGIIVYTNECTCAYMQHTQYVPGLLNKSQLTCICTLPESIRSCAKAAQMNDRAWWGTFRKDIPKLSEFTNALFLYGFDWILSWILQQHHHSPWEGLDECMFRSLLESERVIWLPLLHFSWKSLFVQLLTPRYVHLLCAVWNHFPQYRKGWMKVLETLSSQYDWIPSHIRGIRK